MGKQEIQKSIEVFENLRKHICVEKDGSISYSSDLVRAFEIAIESIGTIEKIEEIIREEEHYEVSNSFENPHPSKADYDAVHADKFNRIWKTISDMESKLNCSKARRQ